MPKVAWGKLIRHIMAEKGVRSQEQFANDVGISTDTVGRWLSNPPKMPSDVNRKKVARYCGVSDNQLGYMWTEQMIEEYGPYRLDTGFQPGEVREDKTSYGGPSVLVRAKAMARWDLSGVPLDQAPPLHLIRDEIKELVAIVGAFYTRTISRLETLMLRFEDLYEAARHTAAKMKPDGER